MLNIFKIGQTIKFIKTKLLENKNNSKIKNRTVEESENTDPIIEIKRKLIMKNCKNVNIPFIDKTL